MKVQVDKSSDVPIRHQLREQIIFLISTGELPIGRVMPSVRKLERQLGVSRNTVSHVYADLVRERWLVKQRGSRHIVVQRPESANGENGKFGDLDDLISHTIRLAHQHGYSLQQLSDRIRERLLAEPPDHLLIVEPERELGNLMREEVRQAVGQAPLACSIITLQQNPSRAIGAVLLTPAYLMDGLECIPSKDRTTVRITYSSADKHLAAIRNLSRPSVIGVLSVSAGFLKTANGVLGPAIGGRHSYQLYLMESPPDSHSTLQANFRRFAIEEYPTGPGVREFEPPDKRTKQTSEIGAVASPQTKSVFDLRPLSMDDLRAIDLLFCDSITYSAVEHPRRIEYRLISDESLREIVSAAKNLISSGHTRLSST